MNQSFLESLTVIDSACWIACFWWMHRISKRQDALLKELSDQGGRIEELTREEHTLVKEMHPKVASIEGGIGEVADAVNAGKE